VLGIGSGIGIGFGFSIRPFDGSSCVLSDAGDLSLSISPSLPPSPSLLLPLDSEENGDSE
jgi:hypothetical protein